MSTLWIVTVFNDYSFGPDEAYGPFETEDAATDWAVDFNADSGWDVHRLKAPSEAPPGDRENAA